MNLRPYDLHTGQEFLFLGERALLLRLSKLLPGHCGVESSKKSRTDQSRTAVQSSHLELVLCFVGSGGKPFPFFKLYLFMLLIRKPDN